MSDFCEDRLLTVLPGEGPGGAVAVHLTGGVLVTQDVVTHHRHQTCTEHKYRDWSPSRAFLRS